MNVDIARERLAEAAHAAAYAAGYHAGMADAMRLLCGTEAAPVAIAAIDSTSPEPAPARPTRKPSNGQRGNHSKQFAAAADRRLKIAKYIQVDGPASMDEITRELDLKYHAVYSVVNNHQWFEIGEHDRKVHLTTEGTNAAREANGQSTED